MSLLRLLTAGKSLVGLDNDGRRYRPTDPRSMPRFGAKKNPFRSKAKPKQAGEATVKSAPEPARTPSASIAKNVESRSAASQGWFGGLKARLSSWFAPRKRQTKPALPPFTKSPLQGELSLNSVKVVRNDLSDMDLEIVPARPERSKSNVATSSKPELQSQMSSVKP